jgi:hypothetical protein
VGRLGTGEEADDGHRPRGAPTAPRRPPLGGDGRNLAALKLRRSDPSCRVGYRRQYFVRTTRSLIRNYAPRIDRSCGKVDA